MKKLLLLFLAGNVEFWNAFEDVCFGKPIDESSILYSDESMEVQDFVTKLAKTDKVNKYVKLFIACLMSTLAAISLSLYVPFMELYILYVSIAEALNVDFDINNLYDTDYMNRPLFR